MASKLTFASFDTDSEDEYEAPDFSRLFESTSEYIKAQNNDKTVSEKKNVSRFVLADSLQNLRNDASENCSATQIPIIDSHSVEEPPAKKMKPDSSGQEKLLNDDLLNDDLLNETDPDISQFLSRDDLTLIQKYLHLNDDNMTQDLSTPSQRDQMPPKMSQTIYISDSDEDMTQDLSSASQRDLMPPKMNGPKSERDFFPESLQSEDLFDLSQRDFKANHCENSLYSQLDDCLSTDEEELKLSPTF